MNKRAKQPLETIRAWVPWTLLGLGLAELGLSIFQWFELRAVQEGMIEIYMNAREEALQFYTNYGYELLGPAHLLFGAIPHFRMRKRLR